MIEYVDRNARTIAWVHQDGDRLGNPAIGSTPDPKYLFHDGARYKFSEFAPSPPLGRTRHPRRER